MDYEIRPIDNFKGKGLFAKKDIKTGTVIFEENPLVCCQFSWNAAYYYKACDHCLRPLETAEENARRLTGDQSLELLYSECCTTDKNSIVACDQCGVEYCSQICKTTAFNQYHKTLCIQTRSSSGNHPLEQLNDAWKQVHYPPETSTIMIIPRILATILQSNNRDETTALFMQFCHRTVSNDCEVVHKMLGDKFSDQISLLHELLLKAVPHEGIEQFLMMDGFLSLLALIGTNGQGVGTSAFSQWVTKSTSLALSDAESQRLDLLIGKIYQKMDDASGIFLNNEGVALYKLQSACNHSCVPNAECSFLNNSSRLSLMAVKDIAAGEEICTSYLDECDIHRSRHSRQKTLMQNYLFVCKCPKCEEQVYDEDVTSEEEDNSEDDDESMSE